MKYTRYPLYRRLSGNMWDGKKEIRLVCSLIKVLHSLVFCVQLVSLFQVRRNMSGPAVTLNVRENTKVFAVDLVPVFCFGTKRWPPKPMRQLSGLPCNFSSHLVISFHFVSFFIFHFSFHFVSFHHI
jgi:hypothetical protein